MTTKGNGTNKEAKGKAGGLGVEKGHSVVTAVMTQVYPADGRSGLTPLNSLLIADFLKEAVDVRQMVCRHVLDEGAHEFFVADPAVEPAQK
jgi:hypothetical protein